MAGLILIGFGCSSGVSSSPDSAGGTTSSSRAGTPNPGPAGNSTATFHVKGTVSTRKEHPSARNTVALLFRGDRYKQIKAARDAVTMPLTATNPWPCGDTQRFVSALSHEEPESAAMINEQGGFDFPKRVPNGKYLITVGIPTMRDVGQAVSKDWPPHLRAERLVIVAGGKVTLAARSAWIAEVKVEDAHCNVRLDENDYIIWPEYLPDAPGRMAIQGKLREIERLDKEAKDAETNRAKAEERARASGQPRHFEEMLQKENEAKGKKQARDEEEAKLNQLFQPTQAGAEAPVKTHPK